MRYFTICCRLLGVTPPDPHRTGPHWGTFVVPGLPNLPTTGKNPAGTHDCVVLMSNKQTNTAFHVVSLLKQQTAHTDAVAIHRHA